MGWRASTTFHTLDCMLFDITHQRLLIERKKRKENVRRLGWIIHVTVLKKNNKVKLQRLNYTTK